MNESGNILVYILGAIFLLGLLTVISKGSITPGAGIDQETLMIRVSEVQEYGQELEQAVSYVMMNGHSEADIRFAHPDADSAYGDITDTPTRQIFSRDGGGATYREPPSGIQTTATDWVFTGKNAIREVGSGTTCASPSCTELIALLMNVNEKFCITINDKNGIINPSSPPQDDGDIEYSIAFDGNFSTDKLIHDSGGNLKGFTEGCFEGDTDPPAGTYHYYRVLLAR